MSDNYRDFDRDKDRPRDIPKDQRDRPNIPLTPKQKEHLNRQKKEQFKRAIEQKNYGFHSALWGIYFFLLLIQYVLINPKWLGTFLRLVKWLAGL